MERAQLAEALLREATAGVRVQQAAGFSADSDDLPLTQAGRDHLRSLWPDGPAGEELEHVRAVIGDWIDRQDALRRKRNHFLKHFRERHGFDRSAYDADQQAAYEEGLAAINADESEGLSSAAERLLGR